MGWLLSGLHISIIAYFTTKNKVFKIDFNANLVNVKKAEELQYIKIKCKRVDRVYTEFPNPPLLGHSRVFNGEVHVVKLC